MACAFGMEACKHYYSVRYVRLPDLLLDLQASRDNGTFSTVLKKYTKPIVLIIDEWLLLKRTEAEARNLFELIHKRRKNLQRSFVLSFVKVNGTSKSVMAKVLLPMPSWIVYRMIPIRSILKVFIKNATSCLNEEVLQRCKAQNIPVGAWICDTRDEIFALDPYVSVVTTNVVPLD